MRIAESTHWTGGQYSLYRIIFGGYLFAHLVSLLPWATELFSKSGVLPATASPLIRLFPNLLAWNDSPLTVTILMAAGALASLLFLLGIQDRVAGIIVWYVLACLLGRNPLISNPALPYLGWLLIAHAFVPGAPYGSWSARGRIDPRGNWRFPSLIYSAAWFAMSIGYTYSGYTKLISPSWADGTALLRVLHNPLARPAFLRDIALSAPEFLIRIATWGALGLELLFLPLALFRRVRPFIWTAMLAMHLGLTLLVDFADLSFGMVILHLFTFDPRWLPARWPARKDRVFYDGTCALCHGFTRFILSEDRAGTAFTFAPLQGETFAREVGERTSVPDSVVVRTQDGKLLMRSSAAIYVLQRLGGMWRAIAAVLSLVPRAIRDKLYDAVAATRYRIFGRKESACPLLPPEYRSRFLP